MSTRRRTVDATPEQVWRVLEDGWLYPLFVVGASRMRAVDFSWPEVGSQLHHSVGVWPALLDDTTEVLEVEPPRRIKLRARGWPAGAAHVEITVAAEGSGCEITIAEDAVSGPGTLVPKVARDPQIALRNDETLRRLGYVARGRG